MKSLIIRLCAMAVICMIAQISAPSGSMKKSVDMGINVMFALSMVNIIIDLIKEVS